MFLLLLEAEHQIPFFKRVMMNTMAMIATQVLLVDGGSLGCQVSFLFEQVHR
jgi:hypothetical protein